MTSETQDVPVVIVGGGLAGLTAACLLRLFEVPCVLLEKHQASSLHPRAVGFTTRTMEIFDVIGIVNDVPQTTADFRLRRMQVESLAGKWTGELGQKHGAAQPQRAQFSPFLGAAIAQDKLEPLLRKRAQELGCDIRFKHRVLSFKVPDSDDEQVHITVSDQTGAEYTLLAAYVLAADGHRSDTRTALKIPMHGRGYLKSIHSVLFNAPSLDVYLDKGFHQFAIDNPAKHLKAFLTTYNDSRWVLMFQDEKERDASELDEAIVQASGVPDLQYNIVTTGKWELKAQIADTFSYPPGNNSRIFLLGDAAHTLPPTRGGYGANTGIGDAHNIAWKLASVLHGRSKPELLASYDAERRPTAMLRHNQTFAGPDYTQYRKEGEDYGPVWDALAVELGQVYDSAIVIGGHKSDTQGLVLRPEESKGAPGVRAPHLWLLKNGKRESSLTLFGKGWTLITANPAWNEVANSVSKRCSLPVTVICPDGDSMKEELEGALSEQFGLIEGAASLVRPDGVVAWRSKNWSSHEKAQDALDKALSTAACLRANL